MKKAIYWAVCGNLHQRHTDLFVIEVTSESRRVHEGYGNMLHGRVNGRATRVPARNMIGKFESADAAQVAIERAVTVSEIFRQQEKELESQLLTIRNTRADRVRKVLTVGQLEYQG